MKSKLNRNVKQRRTVLYSYLVEWHIIPDNNKNLSVNTLSNLGFGDLDCRFLKHKIEILGRPNTVPGKWVEVVTEHAVKA